MKKTRNPYPTQRGFLPNPMNALYDEDAEISDAVHIQQIVNLASELEDEIAGGFDLDSLLFQIKDNSLGFVKNGLIAFKIKSLKLYEGVSRTFKQFCQDVLGYSVWQVNRLIVSAKVCIELIAAGFEILPKCEAQCRELRACCDTEQEIVWAWRSVIENIEPHKITAKSIRAHLKPDEEKDEPDTEKIEVSQDLFAAMHYYARNAQMTVVQLLEEIFQPKMDCANWAMDKKIEAWQEDLEKMVNEYGNSA